MWFSRKVKSNRLNFLKKLKKLLWSKKCLPLGEKTIVESLKIKEMKEIQKM